MMLDDWETSDGKKWFWNVQGKWSESSSLIGNNEKQKPIVIYLSRSADKNNRFGRHILFTIKIPKLSLSRSMSCADAESAARRALGRSGQPHFFVWCRPYTKVVLFQIYENLFSLDASTARLRIEKVTVSVKNKKRGWKSLSRVTETPRDVTSKVELRWIGIKLIMIKFRSSKIFNHDQIRFIQLKNRDSCQKLLDSKCNKLTPKVLVLIYL